MSVTPREELYIKRIYLASACKVSFSPYTIEIEFLMLKTLVYVITFIVRPVTESIGMTQKLENNRRCHNGGKVLPGKSSRFIATCKTCNAFEGKPFYARVKCGGEETCNRDVFFFNTIYLR